MKLNADKHCLAVPSYKIGQQVWLTTKNLWLTCASCKLSERWLGPYKIISLAGPNAVKLQLLRSLQIHPVANISWIKLYHKRMEGQTSYQLRLVHMTGDRDNEWDHFLKMVSTQFKMQVEQWMSNAGGEYKSKAFDSMLKEQGICILQSAPHTPQQNGHAEQSYAL